MGTAMLPTVGRVVHFVQQHSPEHLVALVCHVHAPGAFHSDPKVDGTMLNLATWDPKGHPTDGLEGVPEDQTGQRKNSWHWPERLSQATPFNDSVSSAFATAERVAKLEATVEKLVGVNNALVERLDALEPLVDALNDGITEPEDDDVTGVGDEDDDDDLDSVPTLEDMGGDDEDVEPE